jgi:hypothetical protein
VESIKSDNEFSVDINFLFYQMNIKYFLLFVFLNTKLRNNIVKGKNITNLNKKAEPK